MGEPLEHPLSVALGSDWRWLRDAARDTVVILHRGGVWVEVDAAGLWAPDPPETLWADVASLLAHAAADEWMHGQHVIETHKIDDRVCVALYGAARLQRG